MKINLLSSFRNYLTTRICKTLARCWLVSTTYGQVYGFTSHTRDITYQGTTYSSILGFQSSDVRTTDNLTTDNLSVQSFLSNADEQLIAAGVFDHAYVEMFLVNYLDLTMGKIIEKTGTLGEITRSDGVSDFELRGLTQMLDVKIGRVFNINCDADLGDDRCKVTIYPVEFAYNVDFSGSTITRDDATGNFGEDGFVVGRFITVSESVSNDGVYEITNVGTLVLTVVGTFVTETAAVIISQNSPFYITSFVSGISTQRRVFSIDETPENDWYSKGTLTFTSGANLNITRDINTQKGNVITTFLPFPYDIAVNDTFEMTAGCMKDINTCINKFNNLINFRGFPYIPVNEQIFSSPIISPDTTE